MRKVCFFLCLSVWILSLSLNGCHKNENSKTPDKPAPILPVLTTSSISDIGETTAKCGGNITSDGGSPVIARGFCWSTDTIPALSDNATNDGSGTGSFSRTITVPNSTRPYFVRTYATNSVGTGFGNIVSFITMPKKPEFSGSLDSVSTCKNHKSLQSPTDSTDSITCVFYTYRQDSGRVILRHENVYLNCCPDSMYVQTSLSGDTISVLESDNYGICGCICLYDFTIRLNGLEPKAYLVRITVGPYAYGQNTEFVMDLSRTTQGVHCYKRGYK